MSTLPLITNTSLLDDLKFMRQIQVAQRRLEREVNGEYDLNRHILEAKVERNFLAHPEQHLDLDDGYSERHVRSELRPSWSEEELKLSSKRTRLHEQLTKTETVTYKLREKRIELVKKHEESNMTAKASRNVLTDSEFERKFQGCAEKSLHTINEIRVVMARGIDPPDGEEDASRRLLRVKEFCNRFSRNYLYPIARHLECLNRAKSPTSISNQKLLASYQVILNGLQAYLNHLPTSIGGCSADKLKMLLKYLLELCDVHARRGEKGDLQAVQSFRMNAELTLEKIEDHLTAVSSEDLGKMSIKATRKKSSKKTNAVKANTASERLSMYAKTCSFRRDAAWKRTTESITQKKYNVKSRYKSAMLRQKQPQVQEKAQVSSSMAFPSKCKLFPKKSSLIFKKTPMTTPVNEDNIETMVEVQRQAGVDENENKLGAGHEELVVRLLRLVLEGSPRGEGEEGRAKVSDILEELRKTADKDKIQAILREIEERKREELGDKLELKVVESPKLRREPTVTVTGPRNAKLICIRDDNSDEDIDPEIKDRSNEKFVPLRAISSSHTQTEFDKGSGQRPPTLTNLRRLDRSSRRLRMLPKRFAVDVIQYKLDFHKYCKGIPMYRRSATVQPWLLMSKISDEVLDFALMTVAREIEATDIADQIYRSELQL